MWCVAELDEEYIRRMEDILAVYEKPLSEREPVVCVDEKPVVLHQEVQLNGQASGPCRKVAPRCRHIAQKSVGRSFVFSSA